MIVMRPILEAAVLSELCAERFPGVEDLLAGYVVMDGPQYIGHMLYKVDGDVTTVLDCGLTDTALVDGGVRACVAAGEHAGASLFSLNEEDEALRKWREIFLKNEKTPAPNDKIFSLCK